jgi:hypothetical protein
MQVDAGGSARDRLNTYLTTYMVFFFFLQEMTSAMTKDQAKEGAMRYHGHAPLAYQTIHVPLSFYL